MEIALIAKNKLGFVLGTTARPEAAALQNQWNRCDKMVISWILNAVEKKISDSILFSNTSSQIWLDLEQRFGQADGTKFFQVKKDLYSISQGNNDIAAYFTEIKKLWDEHDSMITVPTCSCGVNCATYKYDQKMKEKEQLIQLLVGLNDVYKGVRGNILMSRPLPNVSEAYYMLLQEEHQREMSSEVHMIPQSAALYNSCNNSQEPLGLMSKNPSHNLSGRTNSYKGHSFPHSNNNSSSDNYPHNGYPPRNMAVRKPLYCDHCKFTGHTIQKCYKLHGYPPGHRLYRGKRLAASVTQDQEGVSWLDDTHYNTSHQDSAKPALALPTLNSEQYQQLMTLLGQQQTENDSAGPSVGTGFLAGKSFCFHSSLANVNWVIDSGASDHITPNLEIFTSVQKLSMPGFITMPNGKHSRIAHIGSVQLSPTLTLTNVLHVPDFQFNLLSVNKLCAQVAGKVVFSSTDCILQGPMQQEVVLGKACNGLYHVQHTVLNREAANKGALV